MKIKLISKLLGMMCIAALMFSAPGMAKDPTSGYDEGDPLSQISDTTNGGDPSDKAREGSKGSQGSLPFTGLDLGVVLLLGVTLVGTGLVVRRVSRAT